MCYGVGTLKYNISVPVSACMYMCTCTNTNTNMYVGDACTCKIDESPLLLTCVVMTIQVECALGGHKRHRHTGTQAHTIFNWELGSTTVTQDHMYSTCALGCRHTIHMHNTHTEDHMYVQHLRTGRPQVVPQQQVNTAGCPQMIQPTVTYL